MLLGEVIEKLQSMPAEQVMRPGFGKPMSYRGIYAEVAFEPVESSTAGAMLAHARSAIGPVFEGYKGGDYTYDAETEAHVAEYGRCSEDGSMAMMFARAEMQAHVSRLEESLRVALEARAEAVEVLRGLEFEGLFGRCPVCRFSGDHTVSCPLKRAIGKGE